MTLATRCPWCETVFSLSKEQAAARAGMVRCGVCKHTFNALDYLVRGSELGDHADRLLNSIAARTTAPAAKKSPAAPVAPAPSVHVSPRVTPVRAADDREPTLGMLADLEDTQPDPPPLRDSIGSSDPIVEPSFLRSGREEEVPRMSGAAIAGWGVLSLFALVILAGQAAYQWRGEILQRMPQLEAQANELCAMVGCHVEPPGDIELLSIESSSLEPAASRQDVVIFTSLLRSRSPVTERLPAFELTLTDAQDHPTVRRVLLPRDYLSAKQRNLIDRGFAPNTELPVNVTLEVSNADVSGYQVKLFYP